MIRDQKKTVTLIYCISCEQLVELNNSSLVFKTGYYNNEYPLGRCNDCGLGEIYGDPGQLYPGGD
jgi:hypothetical protein